MKVAHNTAHARRALASLIKVQRCLDRLGAPADIGAHLDLAIHRLRVLAAPDVRQIH